MPHRPDASPRQGRGRTGGSPGIVRLLCFLSLACLTGTPGWAQQQAPAGEYEVQRVIVSGDDTVMVAPLAEVRATDRDSLMVEIRRYSRMIESMRDSLSGRNLDISLSEEQEQMLRRNIEEFSLVIDRIAREVSQLEFEVRDNTISLLNEAGEGIVINIPENLDERLSEGFQVLSEMILNELPDSVDFDAGQGFDWTNFIPEPPPPPRKTVQGNIIKVGDDLHILSKEEIRGNVVVVFGDAEVSGKVDGNVVAVGGNLFLDQTAVVTGKIVSIGGRLDQDPEAVAHDVIAVDLWQGRGDYGLAGLFDRGLAAFLVRQGTFLLTVLLAALAILVTPRDRLVNITANLRASPGPALGLGLIGSTIGFFTALLLMAVLVLTVIGVPLALLVFMALLVAIVLAVGVCGAAIGQRLCGFLGQDCRNAWLAVVVGMIGLHLVSFLGSLAALSGSVPALATGLSILGIFIKTVAFLLGLGGIILSRLGTRAAA